MTISFFFAQRSTCVCYRYKCAYIDKAVHRLLSTLYFLFPYGYGMDWICAQVAPRMGVRVGDFVLSIKGILFLIIH
jgi:hypothetical protein